MASLSVFVVLALSVVSIQGSLPDHPVLAQPLHYYWNAKLRDDYYTTSWSDLGTGKDDFQYHGVIGLCYQPQEGSLSGPVGTVPLYRSRSATHNNHFYTTKFKDILDRKGDGYYFEFIQCYIYKEPRDGTLPLFHYWNEDYKNDFYTTDWEYYTKAAPKFGYKLKEIIGYIYETGHSQV